MANATREQRSARLAVLIDAENTSSEVAEGLFAEIAAIGEASVRRIYGDFSGPRLKRWVDKLSALAIMPHQNFAYTTGKNASDIALVIDAMDLLHSGRFDGFCLVSSDSDFTRLAARIREEGIDVFGFGQKKTPESFRQACRRFVYTENLLPGVADSGPAAPSEVAPATEAKPPSAAVPLIRKAIGQLEESADGWVHLSQVGGLLTNLETDFDPRNYGQTKLVYLIERAGAFDVDRAEGGAVRIREKRPPKATTPQARSKRDAK